MDEDKYLVGYAKGVRDAVKTPEYRAWISMKQRCLNKRCREWPTYGARGISVCKRWLASFENFLADVGKKPVGGRYDLDRVNPNGNYEPNNAMWRLRRVATRSSQRNNLMIEINGVVRCATEWAEIAGLYQSCVSRRYKSGWRGEDLLRQSQRKQA